MISYTRRELKKLKWHDACKLIECIGVVGEYLRVRFDDQRAAAVDLWDGRQLVFVSKCEYCKSKTPCVYVTKRPIVCEASDHIDHK